MPEAAFPDQNGPVSASGAAHIAPLLAQLRGYKQKYYLNYLIRGVLLALALLLSAFLVVNALEFWGQFDPSVRTVLVYAYLTLLVIAVGWQVGVPALNLMRLDAVLSNDEAARQIGRHFPQVQDKLVNTLQLASISAKEGSLLEASIRQKTNELRVIPFVKAIDLSKNRRYLRYVLPPVALAMILGIFIPQFFTEGTTRLVNYQLAYLPKAPFSFNLLTENLTAYRGEDFAIKLSLEGQTLPEQVYVLVGGRPQKMDLVEGQYVFVIRNIQRPTSFQFEAAGFNSQAYDIELRARPSLVNFRATLNYPAYLGRQTEQLDNVGNFTLPEGTTVTWSFNSQDTDTLILTTVADGKRQTASRSGNEFGLKARFMQSTSYEIGLRNQYAQNQEPIRYQADVIPDLAPTISVEQYQDSNLYNYLLLGGNLGDDYGLTRLALQYRIVRKQQGGGSGANYRTLPIRIAAGQIAQQYVYNWAVDSLGLRPGDVIDYYLQVWDNDGVHGPKSTRTAQMRFALPDAQAISQQLAESGAKAEKQMTSSLRKAESLRRDLQKAEERLRGKNQLNYQDQKAVEDLLKKQQEVRQEVEAMQQQYQQLAEQQNRFEKPNEELAKKLEDLKQIMDQLLDPETKRLYDELQRLLQEKTKSPEQLQQVLDQLQKKENNLSKELDRTLQLFKQLQVDQQLNKAVEKLNQLAERQEQLADKTEKQDPKAGDKDAKADKKGDPKAGDKDQKGDPKAGDKDQKGDPKAGDKDQKGDPKAGDKDQKGDPKAGDKDQKGDDKAGDKDQKGDDSKDGDQQNKSDDKAGEKGSDPEQNKLTEEQKELQKEFEQIQDDIKKLEELNKDLEQPNKLPDNAEQQKDVKSEQEQSKQNLAQKQNKKAGKNQRKAAKKMKEMAAQMAASAEEDEKEENEENADDLARILDNLIALSFDQEGLMKDFRAVYPSDPRFIPLGQKQLKLRDDAKIIEDSLTALAKRVAQISTFITRELADMKNYMDDATVAIKQKRQDIAAGKQQFAMTSMNNLALLLSDVLKQMQDQQQQQQSAGSKGKKKKKPKPGQGSSLSQLQKQLNQQIQQLQQGQKSGRQLSEQLAQMAAQQEALRKALAELEKQQMSKDKGNKGNGGIGQLKDLMEKTEQDLVNKRLTPEVIRRQGDILTRLLEAENAMREREQDPKRESKSAQEILRNLPPSFSQYLKQKEQQVELLKTLPPNLTPFYKQETTRYFQGLK